MPHAKEASAIFLRSGDSAAWRFAVDLVGAGIASQDRVTLVLFQAALTKLLAAPGAEMEPVVGDLALVRRLGQVTESFELIVCSGAVEAAGADADVLLDDATVDEVCGLPEIWRRTRASRVIVI